MMISISGVHTGAVRSVAAAGRTLPKVRKPEEESRPQKPAMDEYVPEKQQEPSGRYWIGKDEDGRPKVYFDGPERTANAPKEPAPRAEAPERDPGAKGPERKGGKQEERCAGNTDKVDREIEQLKKKQKELEQQLNTETDEARIEALKQQLAQVNRELQQKDNDTYRKQHSTFTQL